MLPSEEVVAGTGLVLKSVKCFEGLFDIGLVVCFFDKGVAASEINFYHLLYVL